MVGEIQMLELLTEIVEDTNFTNFVNNLKLILRQNL
jgi:hypothetical protein